MAAILCSGDHAQQGSLKSIVVSEAAYIRYVCKGEVMGFSVSASRLQMRKPARGVPAQWNGGKGSLDDHCCSGDQTQTKVTEPLFTAPQLMNLCVLAQGESGFSINYIGDLSVRHHVRQACSLPTSRDCCQKGIAKSVIMMAHSVVARIL